MANNTSNKPRNVTVTALWNNDKFGDGALLSKAFDQQTIDAIKTIKPGQKFLLKPYRKEGKQDTFFLEILPVFTPRGSATDEV